MGILLVSRGVPGRTIEHSGTTGSTRPVRSPAAPDDMDRVKVAVRRSGTRLEPLTDGPGLPHDGLKGRQLELE